MKGILWYVTRKLEGIFDGILIEFRMRISEDKNQIKKLMYVPRFLSSGLNGSRSSSSRLPAITDTSYYLIVGVGSSSLPAITATSYYLSEVHVYCCGRYHYYSCTLFMYTIYVLFVYTK